MISPVMPASDPLVYTVTASPVGDLESLGCEWRALESLSSRHSFFLSWHWIGSWLKCLPASERPLVLRIKEQDKAIGLAILCRGKSSLLRFLRMEQVALNATGDSGFDAIAIEYNGFLSMDGMQEVVLRQALCWLLRGELPNQIIWLSGVDEEVLKFAADQAHPHQRQVQLINISACPFVDLQKVRNSGNGYESFLSRNTRQALRRTQRHFEKIGPLEYHTGSSLSEAMEIFAELERAHQRYWLERGNPGAFANDFFKQFHTELINSAFEEGHIELARISAGNTIIGYLYNFIWKGTIYAYQSGFNYTEDKMARPGYMSHYLAILHALEGGKSIYDFMAGEAQHKLSLATDRQTLFWVQFRKQTPLLKLDMLIRNILRISRKH